MFAYRLQSGCSLHLYLRYSQLVFPKYNLSTASGPLSVESAPGIIIAHGQYSTAACLCEWCQC